MNKLKRIIKLLCPPIIYNLAKNIYHKFRCKKIVCYTCITGNYDSLIPITVSQNIDCICFTDSNNCEGRGWQIRKIPTELLKYSPQKQNRMIKLLPHKYLKKYKISIYIDGNLMIKRNLYFNFLLKYDLRNNYFYTNRHPERDCIYDEVKEVVRLKKDSYDNIRSQIEKYKQEGFPTHYGLSENCILVRKHHDSDCVRLMEMWAKEVAQGSYRDQLSLFYCIWKLNSKINYLSENYRQNNPEDNFVFTSYHIVS